MSEHQQQPQTQPPHQPRSRLLAAGAAAAIIVVGLGAFAWLPRPVADHASADSHRVQVADNAPAGVHTPRMLEGGAPFSFADLVERVAPSVVTVTVEEKSKPAQLTDQDIPAPFRDFFQHFGPQQRQRCRARPWRWAPASSSTRPAISSPTIMSSRTAARSRSSSRTAVPSPPS